MHWELCQSSRFSDQNEGSQNLTWSPSAACRVIRLGKDSNVVCTVILVFVEGFVSKERGLVWTSHNTEQYR